MPCAKHYFSNTDFTTCGCMARSEVEIDTDRLYSVSSFALVWYLGYRLVVIVPRIHSLVGGTRSEDCLIG